MKHKTNGVAWGVAAILLTLLLGGLGLLFVRLRPYWVAKYHGEGADLRQAFLPLAPLHAALLSHAHLQQANLRGADLDHAILYGADLSGADLCGANLAHANLSQTDLRGAYMWRANLRGADLCGASLHGVNLSRADLQGANLRGVNMGDADLEGAKFDHETAWPVGCTAKSCGCVFEPLPPESPEVVPVPAPGGRGDEGLPSPHPADRPRGAG